MKLVGIPLKIYQSDMRIQGFIFVRNVGRLRNLDLIPNENI